MTRYQLTSIPKILFAHTYSAKDYETRFPVHSAKIEITVITKGSVDFQSENFKVTARENDVLINLFQKETTIRSVGLHEHHTVGFSVNYEPTEEKGILLPVLTKFSSPNHTVSRLIDRIIRGFPLEDDPKLSCSGMILELIGELNEMQKQQNAKVSPGEAQYADKAKRYITSHLHEPIEQRSVAAHLGISPEYLCAVFKKVENQTVIGFIHSVKLDAILRLMKKERLTLCQACREFGFSDPNYVSKLFKKKYAKSSGELLREELQ